MEGEVELPVTIKLDSQEKLTLEKLEQQLKPGKEIVCVLFSATYKGK